MEQNSKIFLPLILSASPVSTHGVLQTGFHISRQHNVLFRD